MVAGAGTAENVDMGPGWLFAAPIGTSEPTDCSTALPSAWRSIGYTESGSSVTTEVTAEDIEVAEELDPIDIRDTKQLVTLTFEMAEVNRANLALAFNIGANEANDASSIEPAALGSSVYCMLAWQSTSEGNTAENIRRVFRKCKNVSNIEIQNRKAPQKSLIPVSFRCVKPTGKKPWVTFPNAAGLIA